MAGKKRKAVIDHKQVAAYRSKLRKRPSPPPLKLTDEERKNYTVKSPFPQKFSIPSNIIYYIARNPSFPRGHLKLISSCKSLAGMSRILPVRKLKIYYDEDDDEDDCNKWEADKDTINLKNQFFKLWIYRKVQMCNPSIPNLASILIKHVYKFSLRRITAVHQDLDFEELQILVSGSNLEVVAFDNNVIINEDGSLTEFDKVFELLCCKDFDIYFPDDYHGIKKNTTNKIIEILSSDQIPNEQDIHLRNIPEIFELPSFFKFLKANMTARQHTFYLRFAKEISEAYKNQLQQFVDEIIQMRGIYAHTVPIISFEGENDETFEELWKMRYEKVEGILRKLQ